MKKVFYIGLVIGVVHISIIAIFTEYLKLHGGGDGLGMLLELFIQPAGLLIGGILQYFLRSLSLIDITTNTFLFWSLVALTQGVFLGLIFVGIRRLFSRKS